MDILNLSEWNLEEGTRKAIIETLKDFGIDTKGITVALVTGDYMAELKERFFGVRETTDVLTFVYGETADVVVCPEHLKNDRLEVPRRIFHGILHALGYDHKVKSKAKEMESLERKLMESFKRRLSLESGV